VTTTDAERVAAARRWFRQQGHAAIEEGGITLVATPAHPDTWDANWASANRGVQLNALFAALERHFGHTPWRVVQADALTDPALEAALALADFRAESNLIEMVAREVVAPLPVPDIMLHEIGPADWDRLAALVEIDLREGKRTGEHDPGVAAGLIDGMRRRLGPCTYWLLMKAGAPAGYGMTAVCPNGLGLIENLFTLPDQRGRGLMSGFIVEAARRLRAAGCDAVFLDAHAHDTPKRLYARLGFAPAAMARTWVKRV
jgi:GNAT superfamily N-acetyltransferase